MALKSREEMDKAYQWHLEHLFATDADWEKTFKEAKELLSTVLAFEGRLGESPQTLKEGLEASEKASLLVERLYTYAHMRKDENNANGLYQGMTDRAESLNVELSSAASFYTPELLAIDEARLQQWMELPDLSIYKHMLHDINRSRAHVLTAPEERILAMTGEMAASAKNIYSMLDYVDIKFPPVATAEGEKEISHGSFIHTLESHDRELRKAVFEHYYGAFVGLKNTFATTLSSSVKNDMFYAKVRKHESALSSALFEDNVPPAVLDSLIQAIRAKLPALHRYMALKKKGLKLGELHMYDLYVSLSDATFAVSYEEAQKLVIDAAAPLGADYGKTLTSAFKEGWVDVYENKGKTSGAYCWGAYGTHPFVLLNHQDNIDSVFTIAHEMGHAMHSYYSNEKQPYVNAQYKIFVAEVASTVNEAFLMHKLLETQKDKAIRLKLVNYYLEQFRTTVFRQVMFAEFEKMTHEMAESGEPLTVEAIEAMYLQLNRDYYGDEMVVDDLIGVEWARISHFYNAFYVYKYATGFASAVALCKAILEKGEPAAKNYREFLSSGGSDYPMEILKRAGVDLSTPAPVLSALEVFEETLDELEKLLGDKAN